MSIIKLSDFRDRQLSQDLNIHSAKDNPLAYWREETRITREEYEANPTSANRLKCQNARIMFNSLKDKENKQRG